MHILLQLEATIVPLKGEPLEEAGRLNCQLASAEGMKRNAPLTIIHRMPLAISEAQRGAPDRMRVRRCAEETSEKVLPLLQS